MQEEIKPPTKAAGSAGNTLVTIPRHGGRGTDLDGTQPTHAHCIPKLTSCSSASWFSSILFQSQPWEVSLIFQDVSFGRKSSFPVLLNHVTTYPKVSSNLFFVLPVFVRCHEGGGSAKLCQGTNTAPGECYAGLATTADSSLLQLVFERDPGYSFTLTPRLWGLKAKSGKDANGTLAAQSFSWQHVASTIPT